MFFSFWVSNLTGDYSKDRNSSLNSKRNDSSTAFEIESGRNEKKTIAFIYYSCIIFQSQTKETIHLHVIAP